jgi:hypothetical protein
MEWKRAVVVCVCLVMALSVSGSAEDETEDIVIECGIVQKRNSSAQYGPNNWLRYIVETQGLINLCGQWVVAVEANVAGVSGSGRASGNQLFTASVSLQVPVPYYGTWTTTGYHWSTVGFVPGVFYLGSTQSQALVQPPPDPDPFDLCTEANGYWDGELCFYSPILVDPARDGFRLTDPEHGVRFDLNADGIPELVSWTRAGSDDAWLAMDRNGNGVIDDGSELFGNQTPAYPGTRDVTTPNGFEALKFLESPAYGTSVGDGVLNANDAMFGRLLLWTDRNHNGISEPDELQPVADAGVSAIGTDYKLKRRVDRHGNQFRQKGRILWSDGATKPVFDVWLKSSL